MQILEPRFKPIQFQEQKHTVEVFEPNFQQKYWGRRTTFCSKELCTYMHQRSIKSIWNRFSFQKIKIKSRFFKSSEFYWSNLPQNTSLEREKYCSKIRASNFKSVGECQSFCHFSFFFCFTFFILSIKNWILKHKLLFLYINRLHRIEIKFV